jgi:hypothetical protein
MIQQDFKFFDNKLFLIGENCRLSIGSDNNVKLDIDNNNLFLIGSDGRLLIGNIKDIKLNFDKELFLSIGKIGRLSIGYADENLFLDKNSNNQLFLNGSDGRLLIGNSKNVELQFNKSNILLQFDSNKGTSLFSPPPYTLSELNYTDMNIYLSKRLIRIFRARKYNIRDIDSGRISVRSVTTVAIGSIIAIVFTAAARMNMLPEILN